MERTGKDSGSSPVGVLENYFRNTDTDDTDSTSREEEISSSNNNNKAADQGTSKPSSRWATGFVQLFRSKSKSSSHSPSPLKTSNKNDDVLLPAPPQHPLAMFKLSRRSRSMRERGDPVIHSRDYFLSGGQSYSLKSSSRNFSLYELQHASENFAPVNFIGKGGYAEVYKGCLQDGQLVAIKRLIRGTTEEKISDFLSELGIMAHVNHRNTTKLIGYGVEGGLHLVLQYSQLGSLASMLHGSKNEKLGWSIRYKVALGTAEGLLYLHQGCQRRIIHRDIKAANILLTTTFEPQICDFGLAKWLPDRWTHHTVSKFEGTFGYLAPEYMMHGLVDEKTDVFAFGVVLLELITGRRALDDCSQQSLVMWAKPLLRKHNIRELVDPILVNYYNSKQMYLMVLAASLCIQRCSIRRPTMSQVLQLLKGHRGSLEVPKKHRQPSFWKRYYHEGIIADTTENVQLKGSGQKAILGGIKSERKI